MNNATLTSLSLLALMPVICSASDNGHGPALADMPSSRAYVNLDLGWRFSIGDAPTAMESGFDDSGWRTVNVPHDWSVEGPFDPSLGSGNGFAPGGIAWYRRHIHLSTADTGKAVIAEFDGVYDNCEAWLNGFLVGGRPYGFESFTCDLTNEVKFGDADNVLSVRVDHSRVADSRWYTGSGIYRRVRLCVANPLHVAHWGTAVTTPVVTMDAAVIHIETKVQNGSNEPRSFALVSDVVDPSGQVAGSSTTQATVDAGSVGALSQDVQILKPQLWSTEKPQLYRVLTRLAGPHGRDDLSTPFGIRTLGRSRHKCSVLESCAVGARAARLSRGGRASSA